MEGLAPRLRLKTPLLLLSFCTLAFVLRVGDWRGQLARSSEMMTMYFPQNLPGLGIRLASEQLSSLVFLSVALLQNGAGLDLSTLLWILSLAQAIAYGVAMFYYAKALTDSVEASWLSVFMLHSLRPVSWNLSCAGDGGIFVYPSHLVLPFLLGAMTALLKRRPLWLVTFLLCAGWIQPGYTLYALPIVGGLWLYQAGTGTERLQRTCILAGIGVWTVLPSIYVMAQVPNPLTRQEFASYLLSWAHGAPWRQLISYFPTMIGFSAWLSLIGAAWAVKPPAPRLRVLFVWLSLTAVLAPMGLSALGIAGGWPTLTLSMPLRATAFFLLFLCPWVAAWTWDKMLSPRARTRLLSRFIVAVGLTIGNLYSLIGWMGMVAMDVANSRGRSKRVLYAACSTIAVAGFAFGAAQYVWHQRPEWGAWLWSGGSWSRRLAQSGLSTGWIAIAAATTALAFAVTLFAKLREAGGGMKKVERAHGVRAATLLTFMAIASLIHAGWQGKESRAPAAQALLRLQFWTKEHIPPEARVATVWPTLHTPIVARTQVFPAAMVMGYLVTPEHARQRTRLHAFYAAQREGDRFVKEASAEGWPETHSAIAAFNRLDERGLLAFAEEFGADYLVREASDQPLLFPLLYQNDHFSVYVFPRGPGRTPP